MINFVEEKYFIFTVFDNMGVIIRRQIYKLKYCDLVMPKASGIFNADRYV